MTLCLRWLIGNIKRRNLEVNFTHEAIKYSHMATYSVGNLKRKQRPTDRCFSRDLPRYKCTPHQFLELFSGLKQYP